MTDGAHDPESGQILLTALNAEMERDRHAGDERTLGQRRHDALISILRRSLDNGEVGEQRGVRPHISIVTDLHEAGVGSDVHLAARAEAMHVVASRVRPPSVCSATPI